LGTLLLTSCQAAGNVQLEQQKAAMPSRPADAPAAPTQPAKADNQVPQSRPQLVKTAEIVLVVKSIDDTVRQASKIVQQQQGDILGLQDDKPENGSRQTASMKIRVPQKRLETTIDALAKLGTIQRRNLTAEDVTDQLVDVRARLRNLRQTENSLLDIMKRSGSVGDVLKVSQELSKVRESIEQIDAQLKSLTNRVAYSTISLQLEAAVSSTTPQPPLGLQVQDTWNNATHSVGELTTDLIRLVIWLLAYSPYLLLFGGTAWLSYTRLKKQRTQPATSRSDSKQVR
jgi:hypothetical protein